MIDRSITDISERQRLQGAPCVVIATGDSLLRWALVEHLGDSGYAVVEADSPEELRARLARRVVALVLDERFDDGRDSRLLEMVDARAPEALLVLLAVDANEHTESLQARRGASVVLTKPFDFDQLVGAIERRQVVG